jgi:hypothetical protein
MEWKHGLGVVEAMILIAIRTYIQIARMHSTIGHRDYGSVHQLNINKLIQLCVLRCLYASFSRSSYPSNIHTSIHIYKTAGACGTTGRRGTTTTRRSSTSTSMPVRESIDLADLIYLIDSLG